MRQQKPALNVDNARILFPFNHPQFFEKWIEGLRLAGLPE
jgi:hypothetical protein